MSNYDFTGPEQGAFEFIKRSAFGRRSDSFILGEMTRARQAPGFEVRIGMARGEKDILITAFTTEHGIRYKIRLD